MDRILLRYKIVEQLLKQQAAKSLEESRNNPFIKIQINKEPEPNIIEQAQEIYNWITG